MWIERFSEIIKDDPFLAKFNILAADTKPTGNEYLPGYTIRRWLSIKPNNGLCFWLSEFFVQL